MRDFRQIKVWEKAHILALEVYRVTAGFHPREKYGITSQLRRAATSVATNIAEAFGRTAQGDRARFIDIAAGSVVEVDYLLLLSRDLGLLSSADHSRLFALVNEVERMLASLLRRLRESLSRRL